MDSSSSRSRGRGGEEEEAKSESESEAAEVCYPSASSARTVLCQQHKLGTTVWMDPNCWVQAKVRAQRTRPVT